MAKTTDRVALNDWYVIGQISDTVIGEYRRTSLLGQAIASIRDDTGSIQVVEVSETGEYVKILPVIERYGHTWTTLGKPQKEILEIPEYDDPDRRITLVGSVTVRASGLRIVENFLDLGHFPYVHPGVLGSEPRTEVAGYRAEIREDVDEVWATDITFHQDRAMLSATTAQDVHYRYRVHSPFVTILYKTCPEKPDVWDVVGLFVQPLEETLCNVYAFMLVVDTQNTDVDLLHFQQLIFLQDRRILENQLPSGLPLDPTVEISIAPDVTSVQYRRWLKRRGLLFGTYQGDLP